MKIVALIFTVALFVVPMATPATTWGWNWNVYNQTQDKIEAGGREAAGNWVLNVTVPSKGSAPVSMTGGYCLEYLYIYTPNCRIQPDNRFSYWINCLGGGSGSNQPRGATCCWNVDVTVEETGGKGTDGFPNCRVRLGSP